MRRNWIWPCLYRAFGCALALSSMVALSVEVSAQDSNTKAEPVISHGFPVRSVAFSSDGRRVLSGSDDRTKAWDAASSQLQRLRVSMATQAHVFMQHTLDFRFKRAVPRVL